MLENSLQTKEVPKSRENAIVDSIESCVDLLIQNNEKNLAVHLIRKNLNQNSYNMNMISKLILCMDQEKHLDDIIKLCEFKVTQFNDFYSLQELAHCYYKKGEFEKSYFCYIKTLPFLSPESLPYFFEIYKNIGNILTLKSDYEGASDFYCKAHEINSKSDILMVNFATLEMQKQNYDQALQRFRSAIKINSANDRAWVGLGLVHDLMGDKELALANVKKAIDCFPTNRTALQLFSLWASTESLVDDAIECLQNYLSIADFDEDASVWLIDLYIKKKRYDLAHFEVERILLWNPYSEQGQVYLAKLKI